MSAVPGALLGVPLGIGLSALASIPALAGTRRPAAEILQAEAG